MTAKNAVRGVAPETCPRCKRATTEKDYRWRKTGACHRTCKRCEDRVRRATAEGNRLRRESRKSWAIWMNMERETRRAVGCKRRYLPCTGERCTCDQANAE